MKKWIFVMLCAAVLVPAYIASATTINLASGSVPIGQCDPNITVEGMAVTVYGHSYSAAQVSPQQVLVIGKNHDWIALSGAQWVGVADGESNSPDGGYDYRTSFLLPSDFSQASIAVTTTCDNFGEVYLNGNWLGSLGGNFWMLYNYGSSDQALFQPGQNVLEFKVGNAPLGYDGINPAGLVFTANISYVPEPSSLLAAMCGLGALSGAILRRRK